MRHAISYTGGLLLAVATIGSAIAAEPSPPDAAAVATATKALQVQPAETVIFLEDLHCAACAKKVTGRLFKLKGVKAVRTSVKYDAAVVTPQTKQPLDPVAAWEALQAAGYQPARLVGPAGIFVADGEKKAPLKVAETAPRYQ
ncbi:MAG TPA: heavy-metal-associated domain-containing protein [Lacipirellulaceae bacterium]|nr:heavy-metal-associated domain-containing protein [Lacipirellulaceae bacterium]